MQQSRAKRLMVQPARASFVAEERWQVPRWHKAAVRLSSKHKSICVVLGASDCGSWGSETGFIPSPTRACLHHDKYLVSVFCLLVQILLCEGSQMPAWIRLLRDSGHPVSCRGYCCCSGPCRGECIGGWEVSGDGSEGRHLADPSE